MGVGAATLDELELPLVTPFETSFGVERSRRLLIIRLRDGEGREGSGECVAAQTPGYSSETVATARWAILELLLPLLFQGAGDPRAFRAATVGIRGHAMAKAAVEMALWDLLGQQTHRSLARLLGGTRRRVPVGVSVGIQTRPSRLVAVVGEYLSSGYKRIKLKVRPGWDAAPLRAVRRAYPNISVWVDANQAYPAGAIENIRAWAVRYDVEQVEQPFAERAIEAHARLQRGQPFRVCLDESIVDRCSLDDAIAREALQSLNVKPGRVGGLTAAVKLGRAARRAGVQAWVGGMLESGLGRAANLALASLTAFNLPGDISASGRYYARDLIREPFTLGPGSTVGVPRGAGLGVEVDPVAYSRALLRRTSRRA